MRASGAHNQCIKVFNTDGDTLSMTRYHDGFLGQRIAPVSCLAFHPPALERGRSCWRARIIGTSWRLVEQLSQWKIRPVWI